MGRFMASFSSVPNELLLDPGLVGSVAVRCNVQRFRELCVKASILTAGVSHGSHRRVAMSRGLNSIPDLVAQARSGHHSIRKTTTPFRILGNGLQDFKLDL